MASPAEHALNVLGAILPANRKRLEKANSLLSPAHFVEKSSSTLFAFLIRYADQTSGAVMPKKFLEDMLRERGVVAGVKEQLQELYDACAEMDVDDAEFIWSVHQLRDVAAEKATGEALTTAMQILREGVEIQPGQIEKGHEASRLAVMEQFQSIDRELRLADAPEGDLRDETSELLLDYSERKQERESGKSRGVEFGIVDLDRRVGGMQKGELILAAGYSSDGKTTLCVQAAWSAAVEQGKNVVFFTTETLRDQVRRKILARHSKLPQFNLPEGLNTKDLKMGTLSEEGEEALPTIARDLTRNPAYGRIYIAQVPRAATLASLELRLARIIRQLGHVDLVVIDYLALFKATMRRNTQREELSEIMKEAKLLAVANEVPVMSPWQVSREARKEAETGGAYSSRALSETAEATNTADLIVSLLAPTDNSDRYADVTMQILKARDGETVNGLVVNVDYATSEFRSRSLGLDSLSAVSQSGGSSNAFSLDELI
ncbi:DnaB-like dsDNA helicase [Microbacterium phage Magritte]|nr:DnaB-like dsDNA helicase [Microbacterium phage Magritte]